ncbi:MULTISPECIES: thiol-activated cytolysin family protein [Sphingobacterium]|uniref:Thiol-activated cytolysin family protein n=1 Tax=Sphingobacterium tenebrionis TaxID=3111775 RepID=A0ABU8I9G5_9SPHI|nr:thiol-activated cytolysin family protein [Sphingobacterium sp. CZ-2]QBR11561.1 hypothetical protein E3D81_04970 [Sphingobacterium sp. CZ-2]
MKNNKSIISGLVSIVLLISCNKQIDTPKIYSQNLKQAELPKIEIVEGNIRNFDIAKIKREKKGSLPNALLSKSGDKIAAVYIKNNTFWKNGITPGITLDGYADEFTMTPEWLGKTDVFHLGSIIKGNSLENLSFIPLSERNGEYESRPISVSVSFPSKTVYGNFVPDVMATSEFFGNLMKSNGLNTTIKSSFNYDMVAYNYYSELRSLFGSNVDVKALFFKSTQNYNNINEKITKKTGIAVSFTQKNFSVDMDIPEKGELYENLNFKVLNGVWPTYINSVVYGSKGILLIESNDESEKVHSAFKLTFSVLEGLVNGSSQLTSEERQIINNSSLFLLFMGASGEQMTKSLGSFDELLDIMKKGTSFSPTTPGVPIYFKMKSLGTHQTINSVFKIDVPIIPFYIKLKKNKRDSPYPMQLSFFSDKYCYNPIIVPPETPIYLYTKYIGRTRTGSPRTGFSFDYRYDSEPHYNSAPSYNLIIKSSPFLPESQIISSSPNGHYFGIK